jgi:hypothetical protein
MKKYTLSYLVATMSLFCLPVFSQSAKDTTLLGLPGDNLDLYSVMTLFQKSKTIEDFEKSLNDEKEGINNLDLNKDNKVDFIKVVTKKKEESYAFILQVDVAKNKTQDIATIHVDKDKDKKVTLKIVGDKDMYGKDYVVKPNTTPTPSVTANPAYVGENPVTVNVPATTTVVVEQIPVVQYVYSPAYVPYVPPYYYGYYPPYFRAFTVVAVGVYRHNNYYYHGGYYGGYHYPPPVRPGGAGGVGGVGGVGHRVRPVTHGRSDPHGVGPVAHGGNVAGVGDGTCGQNGRSRCGESQGTRQGYAGCNLLQHRGPHSSRSRYQVSTALVDIHCKISSTETVKHLV